MQVARASLADRRAQLSAECRAAGIRPIRPVAPILCVDRDTPASSPVPEWVRSEVNHARSRFNRYA